MLDIFSGLRLVVKRRTINIDNAIFRCHWFFTSTLLVSFSLIITARQYVGQPIECHSVDKIPDSLLNSYCWVQSTFTVPQACASGHPYQQPRPKWDVPYPCIDNTRGREIKVYAYYQWVGIVLFIQGLMFHLPYYLWKLWENGLIKAITGGLRVAVLNEQERAKKKEIVVEYIHDHLGCHKRYALKYFLCEFICLVNLLGQLWATNKFFDGQFLRYGLEVLEYSSSSVLSSPSASSSSSSSSSQQLKHSDSSSSGSSGSGNLDNTPKPFTLPMNPNANTLTNNNLKQQVQQVDPMTYIFPRMTKCSYFDFGSSGDVQKHDALCLLPLNIINEKIYIALWFWFLILALLTLLVIVYRLCAIVSEAVRCKGLISRCKLSSERDIRLICRHCDVGDWFLFYMVAENLDPLIMREIIASIASKITDHLELKRELKAQLQQEELQLTSSQEHEKQKAEWERLGRLMIEHQQQQQQQVAAAAATLQRPHLPPPPPSAPPLATGAGGLGNGICASCSQPSSRRGSLVDQMPPLVTKLKKRLYNKRLWSMELSSPEMRQQLFATSASQASGQEQSPRSAGATPPSVAGSVGPFAISGSFASAPPVSQMPLGASAAAAAVPSRRSSFLISGAARLQRRGSLTRAQPATSSGSSSGVSSDSSGSFVMEMAAIRSSSPCLLDSVALDSGGDGGHLLADHHQEAGSSGARWRQPNARHHHNPSDD